MSRLKVVIPKLILKCETVFITNRQMVDGVLVLNEAVDFASREKTRCMLVKMDFEKVYNCVSWDFLRSMLCSMGFGEGWCGWLETLVFNSSMFVLVNGSLMKDFKVSRALR